MQAAKEFIQHGGKASTLIASLTKAISKDKNDKSNTTKTNVVRRSVTDAIRSSLAALPEGAQIALADGTTDQADTETARLSLAVPDGAPKPQQNPLRL